MQKSEGQTGFSPILSFYQVPQPKQCPPQAISVPLNVPTEREKTPTTTTKVSFVEFKWQTQNMIFRCLSAVFPWHTAVYSFLACKSSAAHLQRCWQNCPSQENCYLSQAPDFQTPQLWIPQAPIRGLTHEPDFGWAPKHSDSTNFSAKRLKNSRQWQRQNVICIS